MSKKQSIFKKIIVSITSFSLLFTSLYFTLPETASAAGGGLDTSFLGNTVNAEGANTAVFSSAVQSDGKILIGGAVTSYNDTPRARIARLNPDGSLDTTFDPGIGANNSVNSVTLQPDGKILIGGPFTSYNDTPRARIARLNPDGSLDTSFDPGTGVNLGISSLVLQPDGKILIGGAFTSYNGTPRTRIARLNADGSLDTTFDPGTGASSTVSALIIQNDGKIVIGGDFTTYNGTPRARIARLNADGSLDTTFDPGTGLNNPVSSVVVQSDGKILIGGAFTSYNGTPRTRIARLNTDGSLDTTFDPGTGASSTVSSLVIQVDGKILIRGGFTLYNEIPRNRIARLNSDGTLDETFDPGTGVNNIVNSVTLQSDGKILISGFFTLYNNISRNRIARLNSDGTLDISFNSRTGANNSVNSVTLQPDGKILIVGSFNQYSDISRNGIARVNPDGTLDTSFDPGIGASILNLVLLSALQSDGKILVGGILKLYNNTIENTLVRINPDGTLDTSFDPGTGANGSVRVILPQLDGRIIIAGEFTLYNGTPISRIARINSDGSLDTIFDPGTGTDGTVFKATVQPDGKIIMIGNFTSYNGIPRNRIARINSDGSLDTTFDPGIGPSSSVSSLDLQSDGKILIGGGFTFFNSIYRPLLVRLNEDGSLDESFNFNSELSGTTNAIRVQPDGKILVGGFFSSVGVRRLNSNGSLDTTFSPGAGSNNVSDIVLQPDNNILIAGGFTSYNGIPRNNIARILNSADDTPPVLTAISFSSSNTDPTRAEIGDTVTLSYTTDDMILSQSITLGGQTVTPVCTPTFFYTSVCTATITITSSTPPSDGPLTLSLSVTSAGGTTTVTDTTDDSSVTVTRPTPPPAIISSGVILPSFFSQNTPPLPPELEPSSETTPQTTPSPDVPIPNQPLTPSTSASCFTPGLGIKRKYNDPQRVRALQQFLNTHLSLTVPLSGIFGPRTHDAVSYFQELYSDAILTPIGRTSATGYFGIMSAREANRIVGCQ